MATLRERIERGYAMRVQRLAEGLLFAASFVLADLRFAYAAFAMLIVQGVISPLVSPFALAWLLVERRLPANALGNLYFDLGGSRGAALISATMCPTVYLLDRGGHHVLARALVAMPCSSCILSATVGFCFGCGWYVALRDLFVRRQPEGACDVVLESERH